MRLRSRTSRRRVPTRRSQIAFIRGACTAVRKIVVPVAWKTASKERVKFDPRSRIKNRKSSNRSPRVIARLRACRTVESPVGWTVTPLAGRWKSRSPSSPSRARAPRGSPFRVACAGLRRGEVYGSPAPGHLLAGEIDLHLADYVSPDVAPGRAQRNRCRLHFTGARPDPAGQGQTACDCRMACSRRYREGPSPSVPGRSAARKDRVGEPADDAQGRTLVHWRTEGAVLMVEW